MNSGTFKNGHIGNKYWKGKKFSELHRRNLSISHSKPRPDLRTGKNISCRFCGKEFYAEKADIDRGRKFCSKLCKKKSMKGKDFDWLTPIKRGEHMSRATEFKKGDCLGDKNNNWKGGISKTTAYKSFYKRRRKLMQKSISGYHTFNDWETLKAQYNFTCPCCHKSEPEIKLTEDHIIPISKGGSNNIENIQPLCVSCNSRKNTKIIFYR